MGYKYVPVQGMGGGSSGPAGDSNIYTKVDSLADVLIESSGTGSTPITIPGLSFTPEANQIYEGYVLMILKPTAGGSYRTDFNIPSLADGTKFNPNGTPILITTEAGGDGLVAGKISNKLLYFCIETGASVDADVEFKIGQLSELGDLTIFQGSSLFYRKL